MKKTILISILVIFVAALAVLPVSAKTFVIKGEITAIASGTSTFTVLTNRSQTITVTAPEGFDLSIFAVGDEVIVKGQIQADGALAADWVKKVNDDTSDEQDAPEGSKAENSAYCDPGKKQQPHPMAASLAEKYGVTTEWVMGYFCDGFGMGQIMLALKTHQINGADADSLLAQRASGQGWGVIWQNLKMIGHEKDVKTPPGSLKKPAKGNH